MFTIYNKGSVQFRGTSDNLYSFDKKLDRLAKTILNPDDELYNYVDNKEKRQSGNDALESYKKIANLDTTDIVYHVHDIMKKECITVNINSTIQEAYEVLHKHKINQIPIVTDAYEIVGLINTKTILSMLMDNLENSTNIVNEKLNDIELPEFITTNPISDIRRVAKVMLEHKLDAIPVVNSNDILVGIVSKTDIIKAVSYIPNLKLWA